MDGVCYCFVIAQGVIVPGVGHGGFNGQDKVICYVLALPNLNLYNPDGISRYRVPLSEPVKQFTYGLSGHIFLFISANGATLAVWHGIGGINCPILGMIGLYRYDITLIQYTFIGISFQTVNVGGWFALPVYAYGYIHAVVKYIAGVV